MRTPKLMIVPITFLVFLAACSPRKDEPDSAETKTHPVISQEQKQLAEVETAQLEYRLISSVVSCTGEIEVPPQGMASVTAPLGGYLVETSMIPGARVKKGDILAALSNPEYIVLQQSYLETASQLKFAGQDYVRQKTLSAQNATSLKKMQESESSFTVLKARLSGLKAQLKLIGIDLQELEKGSIQNVVLLRSPISGYVTSVNHHAGQFIEPQQSIFEIVDLNDLHLHLNVFEQDVANVHKGQVVRFRPSGNSGETFWGKVSLVSPKSSMDERTFDVHGHIDEGEDKLKPGMYVEAEILISGDSVLALPEGALVYNQNKPFVLTEENGNYRAEEIETGAKMDGWVEIRTYEKLQGKEIVTRGASRLFTAMRREK